MVVMVLTHFRVTDRSTEHLLYGVIPGFALTHMIANLLVKLGNSTLTKICSFGHVFIQLIGLSFVYMAEPTALAGTAYTIAGLFTLLYCFNES